MNLSNEVIKLIDEIAKRLQIPFDKAVEIATKQLRYMVVMDWIWIVVTALTIIGSIYLYSSTIKYEWENDNVTFKGALWIVDSASSAILITICIISIIPQLVQIAVNPDYVIIEIIKNMVR